jgi:hypothetical protein
MLTEFKEVYAEIKTYDNFFKKNKYDNPYGKDQLYFDDRTLLEFEQKYKLNLPKLNQWFLHTNKKGGTRSFISFDGERLEASYMSCSSGSVHYTGHLYYSPTGIRPSFTKNWKSIVELRDSLSFGDNWYYLLTRCDGCDN